MDSNTPLCQEPAMTSPTATAEIERLAREASPGPWRDTPFHWGRADVLTSAGQSGKPAGSVNGIRMDIVASDLSFKDAAYIAAVSPDVVLGMIAEHRAALEKIARAEEGAIIQRILDMSDEEILR